MRITAELLQQASSSSSSVRVNPIQERELCLRDFGIPAIENMAAALDDFDTWDLSNNRIVRLENLPRVQRLSNLLLPNNHIERVDYNNLSKNASNLRYLILSYNHISSLQQVAQLGRALPQLEFLSFIGNPVTGRQHYRLFVIQQMPNLKVLDYSKVKPTERQQAKQLDIQIVLAAGDEQQQDEQTPKTFVPGESLQEAFSKEEKEAIRTLLEKATSAKEVEEIENAVRNGVLPKNLMMKKRHQGGGLDDDEIDENRPQAKRQKT